MNKRKILAILLSVAMLLSLTALAAEPMMGGPGGMPGGPMGGPGGPMGMFFSTVETEENQTFADWIYEKSTETADDPPTVTAKISKWAMDRDDTEAVVLFPAQVSDGSTNIDVVAIGDETQNVIANSNKNLSVAKNGNWFVFPASKALTEISGRAFYDNNSLAGMSIPANITTIGGSQTAFLSCKPGAYYGASGSKVESYAKDSGVAFKAYDASTVKFTVEMDDNGYISPNGVYYLPAEMLDGSYTTQMWAVSHLGYKIASLTVDGKAVAEAVGLQEYKFQYTFTKASSGIKVTFAALGAGETETREFNVDYAASYVAPAIVEGAVAEGAVLPEDVNAYAGVSDGADYIDSTSLSSGEYYAANGKVYKRVTEYQALAQPLFYSKAEVINYAYDHEPAYDEDGALLVCNSDDGLSLVYGKDYDFIRLYNYYSYLSNGPSRGESVLYTAFLYKEVDASVIEGFKSDAVSDIRVGDIYAAKAMNMSTVLADHYGVGSLFQQAGASLEINNLKAAINGSFVGPSEAGNFFGLGSVVLIDGGDNASAKHTWINVPDPANVNEMVGKGITSASVLVLNDPYIFSTSTALYATGNGVSYINGGEISSSAHGPYVSLGGQVLINVVDNDGNTVLYKDENGYTWAKTDPATIVATEIPDASLATFEHVYTDLDGNPREEKRNSGVFKEHDSDVSLIVTIDEAGTALATDSGGGVIVANQVVAKSYGLRSAGVYTIGSDESWEYMYNSNLVSYRDGGLVSANGGYAFAYNCIIQGVMGLKTRTAGIAGAESQGLHVSNCYVTAVYDNEEVERGYDCARPEQVTAEILETFLGASNAMSVDVGLNCFLDRANAPYYYPESPEWWFADRSVLPGFSEGGKPGMFSVIFCDGATNSDISVKASKLENLNYTLYGEESEWWAEHEGKEYEYTYFNVIPDPNNISANSRNQKYILDGQWQTSAPYAPATNMIIAVDNGGTQKVFFEDMNSQTKWDATGVDQSTTEIVGDFYLAQYSKSSNPQLAGGANFMIVDFVNSEWEGTVLYQAADPVADGGTVTLKFDENSYWKMTESIYVDTIEAANAANITADAPVTLYFGNSSSIKEGTIGNVTFKKLTDSDKAAAFGWSKYFSDVKTDVEEIDALAEKGIALGFGDGTYKPNAAITEAHFNLLVQRAKVSGVAYEKGMTRAEAAVAIYKKLG